MQFSESVRDIPIRSAMASSASTGLSPKAHVFCCEKKRSTHRSRLSEPAQRASMKLAVASGSSGNSRKMNLARPLSMYFAFSSGQVVSGKAAQWLQVGEAYAMIVIDADGDPWTRSGKGTIVISRSIGTVAGGVASEAVAAGSPAYRAYA